MSSITHVGTGRAVWNPRRPILIGLVYLYVAVLILAPLVGLITGTFAQGLAPIGRALSDPDVLGAFGRTLLIGLITVAVHMVFGTMVAWVLVRHRFAGRRVVNALIDLPFAVSPVIAGYMLLLLFGRRGLLTPITNQLGITVAFALPGMILATMFVSLPFLIRELMPVLEAFGTEQEQAAATLGASGWQTFWRVTFPLIRPAILAGAILAFTLSFDEVVVTFFLTGREKTLPLLIWGRLRQGISPEINAAASVIVAVSLAGVLLSNRLSKQAAIGG